MNISKLVKITGKEAKRSSAAATNAPKFSAGAKTCRMPRMLSLIAAALWMAVAGNATALSNSAQVPVLLYHSGEVRNPCDYGSYASVALAADLENFHQRGITVVPLYWITEWALGLRDGSTLPDKVVGITTDDGNELDWNDLYLPQYDCGPWRKSFKTVIQEFHAAHPEYPWYSPHVSTFVIASPVARSLMTPGPQYWTDGWWAAAQASGMMEVYNHGTDHDILEILSKQLDSALGIYVPVGGNADGDWKGHGDFARINDYLTSKFEVTKAATFIAGKTGAWPDLFAYPFGNATPGLQSYFATFGAEHQTLAAFTTSGQYVSRNSNRWTLGRYVWGRDWTTPAGVNGILNGAGY
ncbi:MAG: hypothetical protein NUV75_07090 [Gallionella sp.]|nr:hypothetical protein [Gallionella sp.]